MTVHVVDSIKRLVRDLRVLMITEEIDPSSYL